MKKVYRYEHNRDYWDRRWSETGPDLDHFEDLSVYPIAYAERVMTDRDLNVVELGSGLGRVLKHYHYKGFRIEGLERSEVAVERLKDEDPGLNICIGDVLDLPYDDASFDVVLAFGLYHNLEAYDDLERAFAESARCLRPGGRFCISMRPNNVEMRLNEWYWNARRWRQWFGKRAFHKRLVGEREFSGVLSSAGLETEEVHRARNVSILYRIPWLREKQPEEGLRRAKGYPLNKVGRALDGALTRAMPSQFCNVLVFIGRKVG